MASRLCAAERSEAARRREDALRRWQLARSQGMTAAAAADVVGVPRATLYRWQARAQRRCLETRSRRPHRLRQPSWPAALVKATQAWRQDYPMWGKAKLVVLLRREGYVTSESTVGRILRHLVARGIVTPVPQLRRRPHRTTRNRRPWAKRLPPGHRPSQPGEIVQLDTLTVTPAPGRPTIKHFTACDPVSKWTCAHAARRATAANATRALDKLIDSAPFTIQAIQVDGGSEFMADFKAQCRQRGIRLWELPPRSPELNGHVERSNRTWRHEFYATWDLPSDNLQDINLWIDAFAHEHNTFRPHQALGGRTPKQYLHNRTATDADTTPSHMW